MPEDGADSSCWTLEGGPDEQGFMISVREGDGLKIKVRPIIEQPPN